MGYRVCRVQNLNAAVHGAKLSKAELCYLVIHWSPIPKRMDRFIEKTLINEYFWVAVLRHPDFYLMDLVVIVGIVDPDCEDLSWEDGELVDFLRD